MAPLTSADRLTMSFQSRDAVIAETEKLTIYGSVVRRRRDLHQQPNVDDLVGDLLLDDQLVLGIDGDLNVVAYGNMGVRCHRPAVGVGQ